MKDKTYLVTVKYEAYVEAQNMKQAKEYFEDSFIGGIKDGNIPDYNLKCKKTKIPAGDWETDED